MKKIGVFILVLIICSCSKKSESPPAKILPPAAAQLDAPANDRPCITGTFISDTTSSVTFSWLSAAYADDYEIDVTNLLNNTTITKNTSDNFIDIVILKNTPYSWQVISTEGGTIQTAKSEIWKFYNSGPSITTYAPFPAILTAPVLGEELHGQTSVTLSWQGSSVENNITGYDVYWGTSNSPPFYKTVSASNVSVSLNPKTTYYWRVITKDSNGNTSKSQLSQFTND